MPRGSVISVDCDLHRIHAWCSFRGEVCKNASFTEFVALLPGIPHLVLFEIAGANYAKHDSPSANYNFNKWARWNMFVAGHLAALFPRRVLVATSADWTKGYDLKVRHKLANATASTKDLRECQAMQWFYAQAPDIWVPAESLLEKP